MKSLAAQRKVSELAEVGISANASAQALHVPVSWWGHHGGVTSHGVRLDFLLFATPRLSECRSRDESNIYPSAVRYSTVIEYGRFPY